MRDWSTQISHHLHTTLLIKCYIKETTELRWSFQLIPSEYIHPSIAYFQYLTRAECLTFESSVIQIFQPPPPYLSSDVIEMFMSGTQSLSILICKQQLSLCEEGLKLFKYLSYLISPRPCSEFEVLCDYALENVIISTQYVCIELANNTWYCIPKCLVY